MVQILFSFTVEKWSNGPMVIRKQSRWWTLDFQGEIHIVPQSRNIWRYDTSGKFLRWVEFTEIILTLHSGISQIFRFFLILLYTACSSYSLDQNYSPQLFSNHTSTKMVINSPRTSTKNGVFPTFSIEISIEISINFHRNVRSPNFHRNSPIQPSDSSTSSGPAMPSTLTPTGAAQVVLFSSLERFPSLMRTVGRHFWWTVFSFSYAVRIWYIYDLIW